MSQRVMQGQPKATKKEEEVSPLLPRGSNKGTRSAGHTRGSPFLSLSAVSVARFGLQPCHGSGSAPYRDETELEVSLEVSVHGLSARLEEAEEKGKAPLVGSLVNVGLTDRWMDRWTYGWGQRNDQQSRQDSNLQLLVLPSPTEAVCSALPINT